MYVYAISFIPTRVWLLINGLFICIVISFLRVKFRPSYFMFPIYFFFFYLSSCCALETLNFLCWLKAMCSLFILLLPCPPRSPHPFHSAVVVPSLMWGVRREVSGPASQWAPSLLSSRLHFAHRRPHLPLWARSSRLEGGTGLGERSTISPSPVRPSNKTLLLQPHARAHTHQATPVRVSDHLYCSLLSGTSAGLGWGMTPGAWASLPFCLTLIYLSVHH